MPFIPTPIAGALSAITATRKNQENAKNASPAVDQPEKRSERNAFMQLFFGPGK